MLVLEVLFIAASPLLTAIAARCRRSSAGAGRCGCSRSSLTYAVGHVAAVASCALLWASGRAAVEHGPHYAVLRWFVGGLARAALRVARVKITMHGSEAAEAALAARERPLVVLSIHSGEGDSLLVLDHLMRRHQRRPRIVMHQLLALDPFIDLVGRRLPNRFVDPRGGDIEREIKVMSHGLGADDAVLIFPEGGNVTAERRKRAIERLLHRGHHREAERAAAMGHLGAPRPGGALAALEGAPDADVIFFAHHGFPEGMRETWRTLPDQKTIEVSCGSCPRRRSRRAPTRASTGSSSGGRELDAWVAARR